MLRPSIIAVGQIEIVPIRRDAAALNHGGVTFADACLVFEDLFAVAREDNRRDYGETRFVQIGMAAGRLLTVVFAMRGDRIRIISARKSEPIERRGTMKRSDKAMSENDRDDVPMTDSEWADAPRVPRVTLVRRALKLSQEDFADRYQIPIGTLRDWEQNRKEPDAAAKAYLKVIANDPEAVSRALRKRPAA